MSSQPPVSGAPQVPEPGSLRCPRCSATLGPHQDWCLECGAPARTRLAPTPNWQLPTVALAAIVLLAGAMLAFAFVKLTDDGGVPATTPTVLTTAPAPPAVVAPPATTVVPPAVPPATQPPVPGATVPGATTPGQTAPAPAPQKPATVAPDASTTPRKPKPEVTTTLPAPKPVP